MPTIRFLDSGELMASAAVDDADTRTTLPSPVSFSAGRQLYLPQFTDEPGALDFENTGADPAVVYELLVEPAAGGSLRES